MSWISRLWSSMRPEQAAADLDEELRFHFEERVEEYVRDGMSRREAERAARLKFGGALQVREESREVKSAVWLESLAADFRFGVRVLRRSRNASLAAIVSLGLAIGACGTAFALLDALVFRPLPLPEPGRLVRLVRGSDSFFSPQYDMVRQAAGESADWFRMTLAGGFQPVMFDDAGGTSEEVRAESISGNGFSTLGVNPAAGRLIQREDERGAVAVLSHAFWRRRFGGSPSAIGRWVTVGFREYQIVGVAARGFSGVQPGYLTDLWLALTPPDPGRGAVQIWGRLRPGVSAEAVEAQVSAAMLHWSREEMPRPPALQALDASRGRDSLFRMQYASALRILALICGLLLLVACANVGNLLIARAAARQPEMTLRSALGASRRRLAQQAVIEAAQIAGAATVVALGLAAFAAPALAERLGTTEFPSWLDAAMDGRTLVFALGLGGLTTLLCGAAPALRARPLRGLLAAQVAFSVTVLFLSGLLLTSFRKLAAVDVGFRRENVALYDLWPTGAGGVLDAARRLPGVEAASLAGQRPMGGDTSWIMTPVVRLPGGAVETTRPREVRVSPGFFATLGIRQVAGRDFLPEEAARPSDAVIVNQALARQFFPGREAVGQRFDKLTDDPDPVPQRVVGVVANARWNNLREPEQPTIYAPLAEGRRSTLLVRARPGAMPRPGDLEAAAPGVKVRAHISLAAQIDNLTVRERLLALLAGFFSGVALLLAGMGLYGVIHFSAVRRTREIAIRMALGARRGSVVRLIAGQTSAPVALGMLAGIGGGAALARLMESQLFGVSATDFWSVGTPVVCVAIAAAAALLPPALRAAKADPAVVLRAE